MHWGIKPAEVQVMNMQPNQIAAAWERGDIDAAFVWDPALGRIKQKGKVLITSGELSKKGRPTFDGMAVARKWGEANQDFANLRLRKFDLLHAERGAELLENRGADLHSAILGVRSYGKSVSTSQPSSVTTTRSSNTTPPIPSFARPGSRS